MNKKYYLWYRMAVLAYYKCEWTDIEDENKGFEFHLTKEIDDLIKNCCSEKMNVPNAAKNLSVFMQVQKEQL